MSKKLPHDLHGVDSAPALCAALARRGVNLHQEISNLLVPDAKYAVMVVGSIAEGTATPVSDVDFLVLLDRADSLREERVSLSVQTGRSQEFLSYHDGIELNLEFRAWDNMREIRRQVLSMGPSVQKKGSAKLVIFERFELQFLHRLRTGWVLTGEEIVEAWRAKLAVDFLPIYLGLRNYVLGRETFEDACATVGNGTAESIYTARNCAESALLGLFGFLGYTSQTRRFMFRWIESLGVTENTEVARVGFRLLFPQPSLDASQQMKYLREVNDFMASVRAMLFRSDRAGRFLGDFEQSVNYALPSWIVAPPS